MKAVDPSRVINFRVWLDTNSNARRPLPSADELATYDVLITSTNRLTREQKKEGDRSALRQVISAMDCYDLGDGLL